MSDLNLFFLEEYSFPTDSGYGFPGILNAEGEEIYGIVYIGVDENNVIYHSYFNPLNEMSNSSDYEYFIKPEGVYIDTPKCEKNELWKVVRSKDSKKNHGNFSMNKLEDDSMLFSYNEMGMDHSFTAIPIRNQ